MPAVVGVPTVLTCMSKHARGLITVSAVAESMADLVARVCSPVVVVVPILLVPVLVGTKIRVLSLMVLVLMRMLT